VWRIFSEVSFVAFGKGRFQILELRLLQTPTGCCSTSFKLIVMDGFWDQIIWGNTVREWSIALGIVFATVLALRIIQAVVIRKMRRFAEASKSDFDDFVISILQSTVMPVLYLVAVYVGLQYLHLSPRIEKILHTAVMLVVTFFSLRAITSFVTYIVHKAVNRRAAHETRKKQARGILLIVKVVIWAIGALFLIDNLGYDITTVIAGLGIGGIAIALAAQNILGDLFSYLVIFFDKPFEIGDFIIVDGKLGTVEYIGIRTTHVRSLSGEQLIFSNTDLTNARVHNYKRMAERRVVFTIRVKYGTPAAKLKMISGWIRQLIESTKGVRFDRAHFFAFGDYSLNFEIVYYVLSPDYNIYMDHQQDLNFRIMELFEQQGIEFALPLHIVQMHDAKNELSPAEENRLS